MQRLKLILIIFCLLLVMFFLPTLLASFKPKISMSLVAYINAVKAKKEKYHESVPDFPEQKTVTYTATKFRDPFMPYVAMVAKKTITPGRIPDFHRKREPLEAYSLDALEMVGTLEQSGVFYGLLRDRNGMIYRVGVGSYVGQNSGKIESISMTEINIRQWVPDNRGGWRELPTKMFLKKTSRELDDKTQ